MGVNGIIKMGKWINGERGRIWYKYGVIAVQLTQRNSEIHIYCYVEKLCVRK